MIDLIPGLPEPVVGLHATGQVTREDYDTVAVPAIREMATAHDRIRLLYVLGDDVDGFTAGAMWEDTRVGVGHLGSWERIAVVTDADWMRHAVRLLGWMLPGEVRGFHGDLEAATSWVTEGLEPAA